jgi:hypothetical protein
VAYGELVVIVGTVDFLGGYSARPGKAFGHVTRTGATTIEGMGKAQDVRCDAMPTSNGRALKHNRTCDHPRWSFCDNRQ